MNNDFEEFSDFIIEVNKYSPEIQAEYFEEAIDFFNINKLYINYFYAKECINYINYFRINVSKSHMDIINNLNKTFLFYHFDYNETNKGNKKMYLLRRDIMNGYMKGLEVPELILNELELIVGQGQEIELYKLLNNFYGKRIVTIDEIRGILRYIEEYISKYPDEQTAIILYYYICYIHDMVPTLDGINIIVGEKDERIIAKLNLERLYEIKLPYVNYYIAIMLLIFENYDLGKGCIYNEKLLPIERWDDKIKMIIKGQKVDNTIIKKIESSSKIGIMLMFMAIVMVIYFIYIMVF